MITGAGRGSPSFELVRRLSASRSAVSTAAPIAKMMKSAPSAMGQQARILLALSSIACLCEGYRMKGSYQRFFAMIATSTAVMYGLMYVNTYQLDHVAWSETRSFMAVVMGASMAIIMLSFMLGMYANTKVNIGIYTGSALVFAAALYLLRSQETVQDVSYMKAMIPHHSIAILTSERAQISDQRVRELADEIIDSQRREIDEMKSLIADLERR
jgi:uncharacterized protein (DUF305 family)